MFFNKIQKIYLNIALVAAIYLFYDDWDLLKNESWNIITHKND